MLDRQEAANWCRDLALVARGHGWHPNDALFLQFGRFCVYLRGADHRKLLHPVVLAPKQDFLSLVPVVCPPGHLTWVDAQAVTDAVAGDARVRRLIGCIYRFANSCEQVRSRPLPPAPLPATGLDVDATQILEARIAEKVQRLQDLADSTTRMLSAVFNGVSASLVAEGPLADISAAVEDLVGSRVADTVLTAAAPLAPGGLGLAPGPLAAGERALSDPAVLPQAAQPAADPLREIWNDVAALRDLVGSRLAANEKQRRLSATAESLQSRVIRVVEAALPSPDGSPSSEASDLDEFSEGVVAQVNFRRLNQALADLRAAAPAVLGIETLYERISLLEGQIAAAQGADRARALVEQETLAVDGEREIDRTVDRLLESTADAALMATQMDSLHAQVAAVVGEEEAARLAAPIRAAVPKAGEDTGRQVLRDNAIGLLLALSSRNERQMERLFVSGELSEEDAWRIQEIHRLLVGANIARCLDAAVGRLQEHFSQTPVCIEAVLADKQILWGLAYEVLNWVETCHVADAAQANSQPLLPAHGTFSEIRLASGETLAEMVGRVCGLTQPLEQSIPVPAEAPVLLSTGGEMLIPTRTHKLIGGVTDVGTFRLSRQMTRWNVHDAAEWMACSDSPVWLVFHSALGATTPSLGAITDAIECAEAVAAAGGKAEVWCALVEHPSGDGPAALRAYRPDPSRRGEVRAAAHTCEELLAALDTALDARLEEIEARLRATGYVPARLVAEYRQAAPLLKETVRTFVQERLPGVDTDHCLLHANEEIDAFVRAAVRILQEAQRQGMRARHNSTRILITALYDIDDQRLLTRHLIQALVRDVACEAHLVGPGLLRPAAVSLALDAGQTAARLPVAPDALSDARLEAFVETHAGADADEELRRRVQALCTLAGAWFESAAEPGPASALLMDFLTPLHKPLLGRERARPRVAPGGLDCVGGGRGGRPDPGGPEQGARPRHPPPLPPPPPPPHPRAGPPAPAPASGPGGVRCLRALSGAPPERGAPLPGAAPRQRHGRRHGASRPGGARHGRPAPLACAALGAARRHRARRLGVRPGRGRPRPLE